MKPFQILENVIRESGGGRISVAVGPQGLALYGFTILTRMMADKFEFLWSEIQNYIAEADAD